MNMRNDLLYHVISSKSHFDGAGTFWSSERGARERAAELALETGEEIIVARVVAAYRRAKSPIMVDEFEGDGRL